MRRRSLIHNEGGPKAWYGAHPTGVYWVRGWESRTQLRKVGPGGPTYWEARAPPVVGRGKELPFTTIIRLVKCLCVNSLPHLRPMGVWR